MAWCGYLTSEHECARIKQQDDEFKQTRDEANTESTLESEVGMEC